jgi:hypothetical protein
MQKGGKRRPCAEIAFSPRRSKYQSRLSRAIQRILPVTSAMTRLRSSLQFSLSAVFASGGGRAGFTAGKGAEASGDAGLVVFHRKQGIAAA